MAAIDDACSVAYRDIVRLARRFTHTDADARDLAQDTLTAALDRGFADWASPARRPWLWGALRSLLGPARGVRELANSWVE